MFRFLALFTLVICLNPIMAQAQLKVDINQGRADPLPISIPSFTPPTGSVPLWSEKVGDVIRNDLKSSGLFRVSQQNASIPNGETLNFDGLKFSGIQAYVAGKVTETPNGQSQVEYRLWDVVTGKQLSGLAYAANENNWRRISHLIADDIFGRLTGEDGYFDSRIVYIAEDGPGDNRRKRLAIMDQDGANHKYLTNGQDLVLTPRFSPNEQKIAYLSYKNNKPRVYIYDLNTGKQRVLGDFPGMTFAPQFSPDGKTVIMSLARNGNTDIYELQLGSNATRQITNGRSIETSPSYSPDGRQVVYESDAGGTQQLYVMNRNGSNARRITFGQGRYASPIWSPRGDLIAFTRMYKGKFYIGVIRPDGSGERLITTAYHVEGPTWSPNGRYLVYFKEEKKRGRKRASLYKIDLTGYNESRLSTPVDGSDPAWSPLNK